MAVCLRDETGTGKTETKTQGSTDPRSAGGQFEGESEIFGNPDTSLISQHAHTRRDSGSIYIRSVLKVVFNAFC